MLNADDNDRNNGGLFVRIEKPCQDIQEGTWLKLKKVYPLVTANTTATTATTDENVLKQNFRCDQQHVINSYFAEDDLNL